MGQGAERRGPDRVLLVILAAITLCVVVGAVALVVQLPARFPGGADQPSSITTPTEAKSAGPARESVWERAGGNLYTGVVIYVGTEAGEKRRIGTVLGGDNRYRDPRTGETYRAVKLSLDSGRTEWRKRADVIRTPTFWVRRDDPAIERGWWKTLKR